MTDDDNEVQQHIDIEAPSPEPEPVVEPEPVESAIDEADRILATADAQTDADTRRIVEIARAEAEAAVIRARADQAVATITQDDQDDQDDQDVPVVDPVPRSRHWLMRTIGRG